MKTVYFLLAFLTAGFLIECGSSGHAGELILPGAQIAPLKSAKAPVSTQKKKEDYQRSPGSNSYPNEYAKNPDSLFRNPLTILSIEATDRNLKEAMDYLSHCSSYPIFLRKMKEIYSREKMARRYGLPPDAKIIEYEKIPGYPNRAIILWMINPGVLILPDELYCCPDVTVGKGYFEGITKCSLVNTSTDHLINTLTICPVEDSLRLDSVPSDRGMDIPFSIRNPEVAHELAGLKYHATGGTDSTEGRARILYLDDYNGDGRKLEFAFYAQESCMGCGTSLFGYSPIQDKLLNYDIRLTVLGTEFPDHKPAYDTVYQIFGKWIDYAFCYHFPSSGVLEYNMDYRGRGGNWDRYYLQYHPEEEYFSGILNCRVQEMDDSIRPSWFSLPERTK